MRDILIKATSSYDGTKEFHLMDLFRKNRNIPDEYRIVETNLSNNEYTSCVIDGLYFFDCTFENSVFKNTIIKNSSFVRCNFNGCRFESCIIDNVGMGESLLETTRFDRHCSIHDVCLNTAKITDKTILHIPMACPEEGGFVAWKKAVVPYMVNNSWETFGSRITSKKVLVKLFVPAGAKRSSSTSSKCRCSKAKVLGFYDYDGNDVSTIITKAWSWKDPDFKYELGKYVSVKDFDENRWHECAPGIHFFMDRETAVRYIL